MQKAVQLFGSLDHAIISWTACYDNACLIYQSEKENRSWYLSTLSGPPASLLLSVNKLEEISSANTILTPKTALSKIDPMEDTYRLSELQIKEQEVIVENWQYQLQFSYHEKHKKCDDFTQAEWRQWSRDMNEIMNNVGKYSYYYLTGQGYNTHFEKLQVVLKVIAEEYIYGADWPISLHALKAKLCQVKAKNPDFCPNQTPCRPNDIHNGVSRLTRMDIEEFEKRFSHDPDHEQNIQNSYQADRNQNYWMSEEYYLWTKDHTRLKKVIEVHGIDYLADDLCQTTTEMIQMLENIISIKELDRYKIPITLEEFKERLSLVKDKKKARYKAERLD